MKRGSGALGAARNSGDKVTAVSLPLCGGRGEDKLRGSFSQSRLEARPGSPAVWLASTTFARGPCPGLCPLRRAAQERACGIAKLEDGDSLVSAAHTGQQPRSILVSGRKSHRSGPGAGFRPVLGAGALSLSAHVKERDTGALRETFFSRDVQRCSCRGVATL